MSGDDWGRLAYLLLLLVAVGGYFVAHARSNLSRTLQQAAVWGLIFLGVIAGVGLWDDIRSTVIPRQSVAADQSQVEVPRAPDGHFYLTLQVQGTPVRFVVDTGASDIVLSPADARRVGLDPSALDFTGMAITANGTVQTAPVRLAEVSLGGIEDRNVRAVVNSVDMAESLLGMTYLDRFGRIEMTRDRLVLTR